MNDTCLRARGWFAEWADGDLTAAQSVWVDGHCVDCADCRAARNRFRALDQCLLALGEPLAPSGDAAAARARLLAAIDHAPPARRTPLLLFPAAATLLAAAALLMMWLPHPTARPAAVADTGFVPVPYLAPIASYERSFVVTTQMPVADLLAEGYTVAADPSSVVEADVLLGEDGMVHAVRLASPRMLKGIEE
jgi:hypothetical protein